MAILEIACFDAESAITAARAGADRIEICADKASGGITPSLADIEHVKRHVSVPVYVMIRPRGGDFVYRATEYRTMLADIDTLKPLVDGFVFGILDGEGEVDVQKTAELVRRAAPLRCTFHRAFDEARELPKALEDIISTGCRAILTSGGRYDAETGAAVLADLVRQANGRVDVMPGGGVRTANIVEVRSVTGASTFHSGGTPAGCLKVDVEEIRQMKTLLR